jgi:uncharacterized protein (TIGR04255 family)
MSDSSAFELDLTEEFERLPHAPIVEAVIHWRARAEQPLDPDIFLTALQRHLPDYPVARPQHEMQMESHFGPSGAGARQQTHWLGFRFESTDKRQIAQFTKNGIVFSRLKPYEHWDSFEAEATRLWTIYKELARPSEVQRLGVRFINSVILTGRQDASTFLAHAPKSPPNMKLPVAGFIHQTIYDVPGHAYQVSVNQTIQPSSKEEQGDTLILDLDVFTTQAIPCEDAVLSKRLAEMRYLKDKFFFSLIKATALKHFREQ